MSINFGNFLNFKHRMNFPTISVMFGNFNTDFLTISINFGNSFHFWHQESIFWVISSEKIFPPSTPIYLHKRLSRNTSIRKVYNVVITGTVKCSILNLARRSNPIPSNPLQAPQCYIRLRRVIIKDKWEMLNHPVTQGLCTHISTI